MGFCLPAAASAAAQLRLSEKKLQLIKIAGGETRRSSSRVLLLLLLLLQ